MTPPALNSELMAFNIIKGHLAVGTGQVLVFQVTRSMVISLTPMDYLETFPLRTLLPLEIVVSGKLPETFGLMIHQWVALLLVQVWFVLDQIQEPFISMDTPVIYMDGCDLMIFLQQATHLL